MKIIWKFALNPNVTAIEMPSDSQVLCAQDQNDSVFIWAIVDPTKPLITRKFQVIGTGWEFKGENIIYISTVQLNGGNLILHVFELFE